MPGRGLSRPTRGFRSNRPVHPNHIRGARDTNGLIGQRTAGGRAHLGAGPPANPAPAPPSPGAEITIETWPSTLSRLTCRRDFVIWENGETLGLSLTDWAVLNLQTRRAERIPEFIAAKYPSAAPEAMPELNLKPAPLSPAEAVSLVPVRAADIDLNNHVTNTRYVELMLGAVPDAIRRERRPAFCDIVYRAEALAGDRIEIRRQTVQPDAAEDVLPALRACPALRALLDRADCTAFRHSLVKPKTGFLFIAGKPEKELVRGFSLWA